MSSITVKLSQIPGPMSEYALNTGATVQDLLTTAGKEVPTGYALKVNGVTASMTHTLSNGDNVFIVTEAKGNA